MNNNGFIVSYTNNNADSCKKLHNFMLRHTGVEIDFSRIQHYKTGLVILHLSNDLKEMMPVGITPANMYACKKFHGVNEFIDYYENEYLLIKNLSIIKHIPHSSISFPNGMQDIILDEFELNKYNLKMSDLYIDKLFSFIPGKTIIAPYSRLWCDVEKYKDNKKEEMSKFGQGFIYDKFYDGKEIFRYGTINGVDIKKEKIKYYDQYHSDLSSIVKNELDKGGDVLLLDLHSYSDEQAISLNKEGPFPDICIGVVDATYKKEILDLIIRKIKDKGLTYQINYPYKGSILPNDIDLSKYKGQFTSIMIEVNKRVYL